MYDIVFYEDKRGNSPVMDLINDLAAKKSKDARINLQKIYDYINALRQNGTYAGEPIMKPLKNGIWELRPLKNRILFAAWIGNSFILLHHFVKKTQRTPAREIEQALRNLNDFKARRPKNGKK